MALGPGAVATSRGAATPGTCSVGGVSEEVRLVSFGRSDAFADPWVAPFAWRTGLLVVTSGGGGFAGFGATLVGSFPTLAVACAVAASTLVLIANARPPSCVCPRDDESVRDVCET